MRRQARFPAVRIPLFYALFAGLWIFTSDAIVAWLVPGSFQVSMVQAAKGASFVVASAFALFMLLREEFRARERAAAELEARIRQLQELQERLRLQGSALEAAANAILITDHEGQIIWANAAFTALTGYGREEVLGRTPRLLNSGQHDRAFFAELWATILSGAVWRGEIVNRRKDGRLYTEDQTITPVRGERGEIAHFVVIKQDISERRRAEEDLRRQREALIQREKLAAMGELLAGVAHELNNPLSVVTGHTALLRMHVDGGPLSERARKIADAAERCARIVRNFLALARQYPPERSRVHLQRIVEEAVELLAYQLRVDEVEVEFALAPDLPGLWADPHQLHQMVVNLITNARDAMRTAPPPRRLVLRARSDRERTMVVLEVADTGPGVPLEIRSRVFEPFFTTKPIGQGTGLGLSLCHGIVEAHRGAIRVGDEPGRGAVFVVELPIGPPDPPAASGPAAEAPDADAARDVLVVDDDAEVGEVLAQMLTVDGHRVDRVDGGARALERLAGRDYDLLFIDIKMPDIDGPSLYREIERRHPALCRRVIFVTGDTLSPQTRAFLESVTAPSLSKPFLFEEVRKTARRVLQPG